jgi:hypothetical protein
MPENQPCCGESIKLIGKEIMRGIEIAAHSTVRRDSVEVTAVGKSIKTCSIQGVRKAIDIWQRYGKRLH